MHARDQNQPSVQEQRCQILKQKNPNLGKFWKVLQWKMLVFVTAILSILRPKWYNFVHYAKFCAHLVYFSRFGMLYREKSGNPAKDLYI
jgi:hypothetical protein